MRPDPYPPTRAADEPATAISDELIQALRQRVAARFYDQPRVIDVIARRLLQLGSS